MKAGRDIAVAMVGQYSLSAAATQDDDLLDLKLALSGRRRARLSLREIEILVRRYGLDGDEPKTLEKTGEGLLGPDQQQRRTITKERVRILEMSAMRKLRLALGVKTYVCTRCSFASETRFCERCGGWISNWKFSPGE